MIPGVLGQQAISTEDEEPIPPEEFVTWNPLDKHANIVLSNGNLTATLVEGGTPPAGRMCRATLGRSSGLWYFEFRVDAKGGTDWCAGGLARDFGIDLGSRLGQTGGSGWSAGYFSDGFRRDGNTGNADTGKPIAVTEWAGIAANFTTLKGWLRDSTGWQGDPVAGTGNSFTLPSTFTLMPAFSALDDGDAVTANFGATTFQYIIPAGFTAWGDEALASGELSGTTSLTFTPAADLEISSAELSGTTSLTFTPTADLDIVGAHQFWRVVITAVGGDTFVSAAEIKVALTNGGTNLGFQASGATISAESTFGGVTVTDGANFTISGNPWGANNDVSAWYKADFGSAKDVTSVGIYPHTGAVNQCPKDFVIEYSDDDSNWTTAHTPSQQTGWATGISRVFEWTSVGSHRYWRLRSTTVDGGTNLAFQECIFGVSDGTCGRSGSGHTAICTATSEFAGQGASRVFDNSTATQWVNNGGSTATITFNFLRRLDLHEMKWTSQTTEGDRSPTSGTVEYSDDNSSWTSVYTISEAGWGSLEERTWQW